MLKKKNTVIFENIVVVELKHILLGAKTINTKLRISKTFILFYVFKVI